MTNSDNRAIYIGDNLSFLRKINTESIDLIATDPPFNKGKDFHATPDSISTGAKFQDRWSWETDVHQEWWESIIDDHRKLYEVINMTRHVAGDEMAAFLCFMGIRLIEMRRVLKPTGSIYIHCDSKASHYLKILMDAIYGEKNFKNEIIWRRSAGGKGSKIVRSYGRSADTLLFYVKGKNYTYNKTYKPLSHKELENKFKRTDVNGRRFRTDHIEANKGLQGGGSYYTYKGYTPERGWLVSQGILESMDTENRLYWSKTGKPYRKYFMDEYPGQLVDNIWTDLRNLMGNNKEKTGYPTQKPVALYKRIIEASSNEGDIVLDPFCGSGTTLIAAEELNRQWIGMDLNEEVIPIVMERLRNKKISVCTGNIL